MVVNGRYGLHEGIFRTLTHPILIISLLAALVLNWKFKSRRKLILISVGLYAIALVATQVYFVPELIAFKNSPGSTVSPAEWYARGQRWQHLSWTRGALMYLGELPLLFALANSVRSTGNQSTQ